MVRTLLAAISSTFLIFPSAYAGFDATSHGQVAVYWGQNSYGQAAGPLTQKRLSEYCANSDIDIIPIAFLLGIKTPRVNFANQEAGCQPIAGSALIYCPLIEQDIKVCQETYGKTILISLGGDSYTEGGFTSPSEATTNAETVWSWFGSNTGGAATARPFGSAVVDGFDFDFESTTLNIVPFAQRLRQLADASNKKFIFTAAPQCPYPDAAVGPMLAGALSIDAIFVQFYNNYCGLPSFIPGNEVQNNFNLQTWDNWAKTVSTNPNVRVFIGVPGNVGGAGTGYLDADRLKSVITYAKSFSSFGGIMVWDASQAYSNTGFLSSIKIALGQHIIGQPPNTLLPTISASTAPVIISPSATEQIPASSALDQSSTRLVATDRCIVASTITETITIKQTVTITETAQVFADKTSYLIGQIPTSMPGPFEEPRVSEWAQCGGIDYTGPTKCALGLVCTRGASDWWYSCLKPSLP